jgi:hypothetical protein
MGIYAFRRVACPRVKMVYMGWATKPETTLCHSVSISCEGILMGFDVPSSV